MGFFTHQTQLGTGMRRCWKLVKSAVKQEHWVGYTKPSKNCSSLGRNVREGTLMHLSVLAMMKTSTTSLSSLSLDLYKMTRFTPASPTVHIQAATRVGMNSWSKLLRPFFEAASSLSCMLQLPQDGGVFCTPHLLHTKWRDQRAVCHRTCVFFLCIIAQTLANLHGEEKNFLIPLRQRQHFSHCVTRG